MVTCEGAPAGEEGEHGGFSKASGGEVAALPAVRLQRGPRGMTDYKYVRCLFCATGKEEAVVKAIEAAGRGRALFPQRTKRILKNRVWEERPYALLPGYVFVYSDEERAEYAGFSGAQFIIRTLSYGNGGGNILVGRDREFADWLWRLGGRVGVMKALQVGDRIEIVDGVFKQLRGVITKMDKRRKTVRVDLDAGGVIRRIWLAYEIVDREDADGLPLPPRDAEQTSS